MVHTIGLSGHIDEVVASHAEGCKIEFRLWLSCTDLYCARGAQGALPMKEGVRPVNWMQSLTSLSIAGCGRLQPLLIYFSNYCK